MMCRNDVDYPHTRNCMPQLLTFRKLRFGKLDEDQINKAHVH